MPIRSENENSGPRHTDFESEPVFRLLCSYFGGDRARAVAEIVPLMEKGKSLNMACEIVIASNGFERSFY